eukprot:SAG31_NODE_6493_length_1997_cov_2.064805_2_plen_78_part_00
MHKWLSPSLAARDLRPDGWGSAIEWAAAAAARRAAGRAIKRGGDCSGYVALRLMHDGCCVGLYSSEHGHCEKMRADV